MSVEKILVNKFNILEYKELTGIELELDEEPVQSADFLYDGRNCAVLIRNKQKAFILINIAYDLRPKLLNASPLLILEKNGNEVKEAYSVEVTKVDELPFPDKFDNVLSEILYQIKDKYGEKNVELLIQKFWPEDKKDGDVDG